METKIQFQKNATILTADGQSVGSLNRFVVNPKTMELSDIVVLTSTLFNHERVIPTRYVAEASEDQIILQEDANDVDNFPNFEEEHIVDTEFDKGSSISGDIIPPPVYGSPLLGMPLQTSTDKKYETRIDQNIPEGTVAMQEDAMVISADEKRVGMVESVIADMPDEQITHFLVSQGVFNKTMKLIPVEWIKSVNEKQVNLQVNKVSVDALNDTSESDVEAR